MRTKHRTISAFKMNFYRYSFQVIYTHHHLDIVYLNDVLTSICTVQVPFLSGTELCLMYLMSIELVPVVWDAQMLILD